MSERIDGYKEPVGDVFMFPMRNETGWTVDCAEDFDFLMEGLMSATVQLQEEYPGKEIWVLYEVGDAA